MKFKIGDIFSIKLSENSKIFFQYVGQDTHQMYSDVIRVFKKKYELEYKPSLEEIINDSVYFYTHVFLKIGIKREFFKKLGNNEDTGVTNVLFRSTNDVGKNIEISSSWWVWKINEESKFIGKLTNQYVNSELGVIVLPEDIIYRALHGKYPFVYPSF